MNDYTNWILIGKSHCSNQLLTVAFYNLLAHPLTPAAYDRRSLLTRLIGRKNTLGSAYSVIAA
ncbi:hypothetical protein M2105_006163 [Paenibacillus sp. PastF-1]|nr:hypothetical protein [Paenibacillus sp. PastF-2]MDF9851664.1 hypothetical protein [Paenibacillus sp. PastM-2]MDF9858248.1 hypothetical protein [Paenibacillus sp. PastF-1]MDH6483472.1 hypothetical protein [Paenibacillus sp. PastH-2]MDH6510884.1 hypothetical protein [Paenibacillus sp. PastM-3]